MASFFGMGRAPHQLSLRVTYEGYANNPDDPDAPILREGTLSVDWEATEETSVVLERIDEKYRALPFNHRGQVVALRLDVDERGAGAGVNGAGSSSGPTDRPRVPTSVRTNARAAATSSRMSSAPAV